MGFAVFLKTEHLGFDLDYKMRSDVYMNSLMVLAAQIAMIAILFRFESNVNGTFHI